MNGKVKLTRLFVVAICFLFLAASCSQESAAPVAPGSSNGGASVQSMNKVRPFTGATVTINDSGVPSSFYLYTFYYSTDGGSTWNAVSGTSFDITIGDSYMFKVVYTNNPSQMEQTTATFKMIDWQTLATADGTSIPPGHSLTLTNTTSHVISSNYTVTLTILID